VERGVAEARGGTEPYKKTIELINEMVQKEQEIHRRLDLVKALDKDRFRTVRVMDEMARRVPRYMWLTSIGAPSQGRESMRGRERRSRIIHAHERHLKNQRHATQAAVGGGAVETVVKPVHVDDVDPPHAHERQPDTNAERRCPEATARARSRQQVGAYAPHAVTVARLPPGRSAAYRADDDWAGASSRERAAELLELDAMAAEVRTKPLDDHRYAKPRPIG
jgi:Tfp pilus assembly protein PilN